MLKDTTLGQTREFNAQIQVLDIPNEIKTGYSPIGSELGFSAKLGFSVKLGVEVLIQSTVVMS